MASFTSDVKGLRTFEAIQVVKNESVWVGIGKTTNWSAQEEVPAVDPNGYIQEVVAYKRADKVSLIMPDPEGTIEQGTQKWKLVSLEEGRALDCRWVYVQAWLNYADFPIVTFRQTGVQVGLVTKPEVPVNKQVITPDLITDPGFLLILNNRSPITREITQRESIDFIIEF